MALKLDYIVPETGLTISNAYLKIMYFKGSYKQDGKYNVIISTCVYASEQSKIDGLKPIDENREYEFYLEGADVESTPLLTLCYNELKKQFPDSINC